MRRFLYRIVFITLLCIVSISAVAQIRITGTIFDITKYRPLEAVSVMSNSGYGTISDSLGHYTLVLNENDSVWFSYLNRPTPKYAVSEIPHYQNFDVSLHVRATELKEISIMAPNYRMDSIQNRLDYAKAFNFRKPGLGTSLNMAPGGGAGLDINELIDAFKFRKNRRMLAFQSRLIEEEELRYIDHRFSRALIIRLTRLKGKELDDFVEHYRPSLEFVETSTDYELQDYIKKSFSHYQRYINMRKQLESK